MHANQKPSNVQKAATLCYMHVNVHSVKSCQILSGDDSIYFWICVENVIVIMFQMIDSMTYNIIDKTYH